MSTVDVTIVSHVSDRSSRGRLIHRIGGKQTPSKVTCFLLERATRANISVRVTSLDWRPNMRFGANANIIYYADTGSGCADGKRDWLREQTRNTRYASWEYRWVSRQADSLSMFVNGDYFGGMAVHEDYDRLWHEYLRERFGVYRPLQTLME